MRHRVKKIRLNRKSHQVKALLRNLATSLVLHESIRTTEKKAKALQPLMDQLITTVKTKEDREAIRALKKVLFQKEASQKMMVDIKKRYQDRSSGFTRITPVATRDGDAAPIVQIEFIS